MSSDNHEFFPSDAPNDPRTEEEQRVDRALQIATLKEPRAQTRSNATGKQPKMIPNPLWCERCDGRGYLVADAEWEPYAVQCADCADRRAHLRAQPQPTPETATTVHYLTAILQRLNSLYELLPDDPRLREHISDETSWVEAEIERLGAAPQEASEDCGCIGAVIGQHERSCPLSRPHHSPQQENK